MYSKTLIAAVAALSIGSASVAFGGEGSPDLADNGGNGYGSFEQLYNQVGSKPRIPVENSVQPFTAAERELFERTTRSDD